MFVEFPGGIEIEAVKGGGNVCWIGNFPATLEDFITLSEKASETEADVRGIVVFGAANWRGGELSSVSSKGVVEEKGAKREGEKELPLHFVEVGR
ncbi:MAG: hypothetical protein AAGC74_01465 [Verrucomicrobiota bacterium]